MKIRTGFVSNSSSSSFVIGKNFMTKKQIKEFEELIHLLNGDAKELYGGDEDPTIKFKDYKREIGYDENTYITEDDKYFFGSVDYANYEVIVEFMERNKLDTKYSVSD